jgi:hypothetical protein
MPRRSRPIPARCELGVTGKRVRRALPLIPPPPSFRDALQRELSQRARGSGDGARTGVTDDTTRPR